MKILILKPSSFGDIVHSNPTCAALKDVFPDSNISWLVFEEFSGLLSLFPGIDRKVLWNKKGGLKEYLRIAKFIRNEKYDLVIDLQGLARTAFLAFISGAGIKIGVPGLKECSWIFLKEVFPESRSMNAVERSLETVRYLIGRRPVIKFDIKIMIDEVKYAEEILHGSGIGPDDKVLGIIPSARGVNKVWPAAHYEKLIGLLSESSSDLKFVVLGSKKDYGVLKNDKLVDLCGKTTIPQLAAVLKRCNAVLGGDTGPVQLAASIGVPTVVLFGGSDVKETAPLDGKSIIIKKEFKCSPCRSRPSCKDFPCLVSISPEEVEKTVKGQLHYGNKW